MRDFEYLSTYIPHGHLKSRLQTCCKHWTTDTCGWNVIILCSDILFFNAGVKERKRVWKIYTFIAHSESIYMVSKHAPKVCFAWIIFIIYLAQNEEPRSWNHKEFLISLREEKPYWWARWWLWRGKMPVYTDTEELPRRFCMHQRAVKKMESKFSGFVCKVYIFQILYDCVRCGAWHDSSCSIKRQVSIYLSI